MSYDNTNTGMLARNERKENDKHPDFRGQINIDGVDYWLSGWIKEGKAGGKMEGKRFFSLSAERKQINGTAPAPRQSSPAGRDEIPF